jgi:hypothetical protein
MTCQVCRARLRANAIFCDTCGQKIDKSDAVMTVTLPKSTAKRTPEKETNKQPSAALLLSGGALVAVGVWLGATFLSSEPRPIVREPANPTQQVPVILQTPVSIPAVVEIKPEPPPVKFAPEVKSAPKTIIAKPPVDDGLLSDPFAPKRTDPDSALNPFSKKRTPAPIGDGSLVEDPFSSKPISKNPDATLKPRFNTTP